MTPTNSFFFSISSDNCKDIICSYVMTTSIHIFFTIYYLLSSTYSTICTIIDWQGLQLNDRLQISDIKICRLFCTEVKHSFL